MSRELRKIIHIDMDAFYASIEQRDEPALRHKPLAVGSPKARGVIAAASYEAREYGVRSAMPAKLALAKCPQLIFVPPRPDVYKAVSAKMHAVFRTYTDIIEPLALDEAFLDVTHNNVGQRSATLIALDIKAQLLQELNLSASAGVSYCKFLAKIASDWNKPNGIYTITPSRAQAFINKLPIGKFFGVGKKTAEKMHRYQIFKGEDLKRYSELELRRIFGKHGAFYFQIAQGIDDRPVRAHRVAKSVGAERTFEHDVKSMAALTTRMQHILDVLWVRVEKKGKYGKTITLKVKFADFQQITRSESLEAVIDKKEEAHRLAHRLLQAVDIGLGVRLLGLSISNFPQEGKPVQLTFDF